MTCDFGEDRDLRKADELDQTIFTRAIIFSVCLFRLSLPSDRTLLDARKRVRPSQAQLSCGIFGSLFPPSSSSICRSHWRSLDVPSPSSSVSGLITNNHTHSATQRRRVGAGMFFINRGSRVFLLFSLSFFSRIIRKRVLRLSVHVLTATVVQRYCCGNKTIQIERAQGGGEDLLRGPKRVPRGHGRTKTPRRRGTLFTSTQDMYL